MIGTCAQCGQPLYGDGDVAMQCGDQTRICVVCFLDPERLAATAEQFDLLTAPHGIDQEAWDEMGRRARELFAIERGRALRQRATRAER